MFGKILLDIEKNLSEERNYQTTMVHYKNSWSLWWWATMKSQKNFAIANLILACKQCFLHLNYHKIVS